VKKGTTLLARARGKSPPDLHSEMTIALMAPVELSAETLAEAIVTGSISSRFRVALAAALINEDAPVKLTVSRKQVGRPANNSIGPLGPLGGFAIVRFIDERIARGVPRKAALQDACRAFRISRSTLFNRLKELREWQGSSPFLTAGRPTSLAAGREDERAHRRRRLQSKK
jgi:hypothetical protein